MKQHENRSGDDEPRAEQTEQGDDEELEAGRGLNTEAHVVCPYCGEQMEITLDPGGGLIQNYVEDCQVCCRPWEVHVRYEASGGAEVWVEES